MLLLRKPGASGKRCLEASGRLLITFHDTAALDAKAEFQHSLTPLDLLSSEV